ncbi:protein kinase domain-containing protein [Streptomyces ardesiacus]|uniref:non-specific serine/threonine protein kinase n=1 Tax=Streptomyces ardesiacus TaxID=285564 RepID=A0ABW8HFW6_9ACTN
MGLVGWFGKLRGAAPGPRADWAAALREGSAEAELTGRQGNAGEAAERYAHLVALAERFLGPREANTLALRHQLAHWTGESGQPEAAVQLFGRLMADRERIQGPRHRDTELARHQLAHWHGRSGRPEEAVRRYEAMRRSAEAENRTETALTLLCEVGYWQQKSGDNAAALRAFSQMLRTAQRELGPGHQLVTIARQRYAEVAGVLPFGNEGGEDGLRDLRATAAAVEAEGDFQRAGRMYGQIAARSEELHGADSPQTLSARVQQAKAAVAAEDYETAVDCFGKVLACMELQGQGPGSPEYDTLRGQRDELARMARRPVLRIDEPTATLLGDAVRAAPEAACAVLAREAGGSEAPRLALVNDGPDDVTWRVWDAEHWAAVLQGLSRQGHEATALCFAHGDPRPTPEEAAVCERLGLPGVYVSCPSDENVQIEAYVFQEGEPVPARVVVVRHEQPATGEQAARRRVSTDAADGRTAVHPQAAAIGTWREMERARPNPGVDQPGAFGTYEVLECVGEGGFGRVYLCQDPDGLMVAVKTLHAHLAAAPGIKRGFAHEVRAAQRVDGRFTVPVIAADTDGPTPWMAVPYVAAPSLQELVERCGRLETDLVRTLGAGIAVALSAIHAEGIVHLDLKPGNVLLSEDGPRVIDFGIAQIERLTEPRRGFAGTYAYASPEQLREQPTFTSASDVFSLGTVLARLALGRSPWGQDAPSVVAAIRAGTPDLAGLPQDLQKVIRACLHPDPEQRPTARDVAETLVPGATEGRIAPPPLSEQARTLVAEHATVPATRRYRTLAHTRAHASEDTTWAVPQPSHTPAAPGAVTLAEATERAVGTAATTPAQDAAPSGARRQDEAAAGADPAGTTHRDDDAAPGTGMADDAADELAARVLRWERGQEGKSMAETRRGCGTFLSEAEARLGARHPLTLRLRVSHAMLGCDQPGGVRDAERVLNDAAADLGETHPTVRDARTLLAVLKSTGVG